MTNQEWHEEWMERFETFIWKDMKLKEYRDVKSLIAQQAITRLQAMVTAFEHFQLYHELWKEPKEALAESKNYLSFFPKLVRCRECADLWPCLPSQQFSDGPNRHQPNRLEAFKDDPESSDATIS